jgi:hypothetical protein
MYIYVCIYVYAYMNVYVYWIFVCMYAQTYRSIYWYTSLSLSIQNTHMSNMNGGCLIFLWFFVSLLWYFFSTFFLVKFLDMYVPIYQVTVASSRKVFEIIEVGVLTPAPLKLAELRAGQVGYVCRAKCSNNWKWLLDNMALLIECVACVTPPL